MRPRPPFAAQVEQRVVGRDAGASGADTPLVDGPGKYELAGIISHMGANTACGHYVCHIRGPDGRWALFNDEKVAASEQPPFDLGYLYLYRRAQQ